MLVPKDNDLLRCALRLEEKAAPLPRGSQRRAYLLAQAKALRIFALREVTPEYSELRAEHFEMTAQSLPEGSEARRGEMRLAHQAREKSRRLARRTGLKPDDFGADSGHL